MAHTSREAVHHIIYINNRLISLSKLDKVRDYSKEETEIIIKRMITFYGNLQNMSNNFLVIINELFPNRFICVIAK